MPCRGARVPSFLSLALLLASAPLHAQNALTLTRGADSFSMGGFLYILEDPAGTLSLQAAAASPGFRLFKDNEPNMGFSRSVFWVRFTVRDDAAGREWLLDYAYPPADSVDLYTPPAPLPARSGEGVPYPQRPFPARTYVFELSPAPDVETTYYLRVQGESSIVFPMKIWERHAFEARTALVQLILGVYFGLMGVMALYNLLIFITSREKSYLLYSLFVISLGLFQLSYNGIAAMYLWPMSGWWINHSLIVFEMLSMFFGITFTQEFLHTRATAPRMHTVLGGGNICAVLIAAGSVFVPYGTSIVVSNAFLIAASVACLFAAHVSYVQKFRPARFYLLAWSFLLLAVVVLALKGFAVLPSGFLTTNALQIGSALEVILLAMAVSDKINLLREEKQAAQREHIQSQLSLLKATEEKLYVDSLTGLPNRNRLLRDMKGEGETVILVNIDHFKELNTFYGNVIGDGIITELGLRIHSFAPSLSASLYRLHADEFALLARTDLGGAELEWTAQKLVDACQKPYLIDGHVIRIDVSAGVSGQEERPLEKADIALTQTRLSRRTVAIYDPSMATLRQYENNLKWIQIIREALDGDRVFPVYQAIMNNRSQEIEKYECLMRLRSGDGGVLPTGVFLPYAKKSRLYSELSRVIIEKSCALFSGRRSEFGINLSIEDISDEATVAFIRRCLDGHGVGGRLVFEILESEGILSYEEVSRFIDEMKGRGCRIAIDDFGTGYSNFEHILRLNVDYLKIDASLIKDIHKDFHSQCIVETIVAFSRKLKIKTIAEYVHCAEVYNCVREIGVDYSQGYFIAEPRENIGG